VNGCSKDYYRKRDEIHHAFEIPELHQAEDRIKSWLMRVYIVRMRFKKAGRMWLFGTQHGTARKDFCSLTVLRISSEWSGTCLSVAHETAIKSLLTTCHLVDAHAAVLIHRVLDIKKIEMINTELLWWAQTVFSSHYWEQISKGKDTMGWDGRLPMQDTMTISDTDEVSKQDIKGKGQAE
jgi:hypothetical protein